MKVSLRRTALDDVLKPIYRPSLLKSFSDRYINESSGVSIVQSLILTPLKMTRGGRKLPNVLGRRAKLQYRPLRQNVAYKNESSISGRQLFQTSFPEIPVK